jgi:hypothetical protein
MTTMPKFVAIDVETTLNANEDVGLAHPMHPDNRVVAWGICVAGSSVDSSLTTYVEHEFKAVVTACSIDHVFCGHNLAFDLM